MPFEKVEPEVKSITKTGIFKIAGKILVLIFCLIWILLVIFIGGFFFPSSPGTVLGRSFFLAFLVSLIRPFIISIIAALPLLLFIRRFFLLKSLFKKVVLITLFLFIFLFTIWLLHSTEIKLFSIGVLPAPPEADDSYYYYHGLGGDIMGISAVAPAFRFEWDKNLPPEEKLVRIQRSIQFYEDFAQKKSWDTYSYFRPYSLEEKEILNSCSELFEKIMKTKGQEAIIEAIRKNWGIIECRFKIRPGSPSINDLLLNLDANGGNIFFWF